LKNRPHFRGATGGKGKKKNEHGAARGGFATELKEIKRKMERGGRWESVLNYFQ